MEFDLSKRFPDAKGFATKANAMRKITSLFALCAHDGDKMPFVVVQRESDDRWLPIVIMSPNRGYNIPWLANHGLCVTNIT